MYRSLNTKRFNAPHSEFLPGPAPLLEWIETEKLVVDGTYQRDIGRRGATNNKDGTIPVQSWGCQTSRRIPSSAIVSAATFATCTFSSVSRVLFQPS